MERQYIELKKAVREIADSEGISLEDAMEISIKALRYEVQRRKSFDGEAECGGSTS